MTENKERAAAWLQALAARGVTVTLRNSRLWLHPASAHAALSDQEVLTLRHCRQDIKALLRDGLAPTPAVVVATVTDSQPAVTDRPPAADVCPSCYGSPCIGPGHPAFLALHPVEAQKAADERATQEMFQQLGKPMPAWCR